MGKKKSKQLDQKENVITEGMKYHLKYLMGLSIAAKIAIVVLTVFILGSGMDMYTINYYYEHAIGVFQGSYPYISYYYEYPILSFVPVVIALIPSLLLNSVALFMITFSILMVICDCITTACVYLIARKIWDNSKTAFIAAFIYITAISTAYFTMIDYGALPSALMMIGLTILFYGKDILSFTHLNEYSALTFGYFAKVFPIIALPFVVLHKSKSTSLKEEIVSALKIIVPVSLVLIVPTLIFNPASTLKTYLPARMDIGYFPNTIIWTLHVWIHDIFKMNITIGNVLVLVYACMAISIITLAYFAFKYKQQNNLMLLKFILCGIMIIVLSFKVRSPSYILWFTPLLCILIADKTYKIGLFYLFQILAYIEFPLTFWLLWTNIEYTNPIYSTNWYLALILFTLEFGVLLTVTWLAVEPIKMYKEIFN
jgi:hypothetical protein